VENAELLLVRRTIENVKKDMDCPESPLMGAHDYCGQGKVLYYSTVFKANYDCTE
jgi:hypothetical protein